MALRASALTTDRPANKLEECSLMAATVHAAAPSTCMHTPCTIASTRRTAAVEQWSARTHRLAVVLLQQLHGLGDLRLVHEQPAVDHAPHHIERDRALLDAARAAVRQRGLVAVLSLGQQAARAHRFRHARVGARLHADHDDVWVARFEPAANAADQPAAAHSHQHAVHPGQVRLPLQLARNGALSPSNASGSNGQR